MLGVIKHKGRLKLFSPFIAEKIGVKLLYKGSVQDCNEFIKIMSRNKV